MRFLVKIQIPVDIGNAKAMDGSLGPTMQNILMKQKPEAAYFTDLDGLRTIFLVITVNAASDIPGISEAWFLSFNATVEFHTALVPADMAAAEPGIAVAVAAAGGKS